MNILIIVSAIVLFAVFLKVHSLRKQPAKTAIFNMLLGAGSLAVASPIIGASVNMYTVFVALTLGVPGTVLVVMGKMVLG